MRVRMKWIPLVLVPVVGSAGTLSAQTPAEPTSLAPYTGARARLMTSESPGVVQKGILLRSDDTTLTLLAVDGREMNLPLSTLTRLDLALERKNELWKGALLGAAAGAGVVALFDVDPQDCGDSSPNFCSRGEAVAGGALLGALVGGVVGSQVHSDRWTRISVGTFRPAGTAGRGARAPVSLAIRFRF